MAQGLRPNSSGWSADNRGRCPQPDVGITNPARRQLRSWALSVSCLSFALRPVGSSAWKAASNLAEGTALGFDPRDVSSW